MARSNEILTGRHNRFIQKLFAMKGGPPAPQLASDVQVVHPIFHGAENRFIESWDRFGTLIGVNGVAAVNSGIRLRNPVPSNVIVVIERLTLFENLGDNPILSGGFIPTDLTTVIGTPIVRIDPRGRASPTLIFSTGTGVTALVNRHQTGLTANLPYEYIQTDNQEFPILPGDAVQITSQVVNVNITLSILWRERALEESERQ